MNRLEPDTWLYDKCGKDCGVDILEWLQVLASASGSFGISPSQICIWDLQQQVCRKVLSHHEHNIVCLDYARDDRFLISVGKICQKKRNISVGYLWSCEISNKTSDKRIHVTILSELVLDIYRIGMKFR